MTGRLRDRPAALLTRHFFHSLFDFGVFTPEGADSFVRLLIGVFAAILAFGFVLVRMYAIKYGRFAAFPTAEPYTRALMADTTLVIGLPMWIVALVTVLVSHSLFPDETDFRVLMPLPIARPVVFGAKLAALGLFAGLFTLASHAAITPLALLISFSRWAVDAVPLRLLSFWAASLAASAFAILGVVAANGLLIALTPRSRIHALTAAMRSAMLGGLMLALPLVIALPTQGDRLAAHSTLMFLAPPAWFLGVQQVLLGHEDVYTARLAQLAAIGLLAAAAISAASYYELYRRFDRVMLRSLGTSTRPWRRGPASRNPARAAVHDFTTATLRRSTLHQGVVVGLSACGVALAVNSLIRSGILLWLRGLDVPRWEIVGAVTWTPIALVLILGIAARAALTLPIEPKANWVFRMTEHDAIRADQLSAAERVIIQFCGAAPDCAHAAASVDGRRPARARLVRDDRRVRDAVGRSAASRVAPHPVHMRLHARQAPRRPHCRCRSRHVRDRHDGLRRDGNGGDPIIVRGARPRHRGNPDRGRRAAQAPPTDDVGCDAAGVRRSAAVGRAAVPALGMVACMIAGCDSGRGSHCSRRFPRW